MASVLSAYSEITMSNLNISDNYCYSAFYIERANYLMINSYSCLNHNNNSITLTQGEQEFGACLDFKNCHNATIVNFKIVSCFSQITTCGFKIYYEKDYGGTNNQVILIYFISLD